jgi:azurin
LIARGQEVAEAAQALRSLPRTAWPREQAASTARALTRWARAIPPESRTELPVVQAVQMAADLASVLPPADAASIRAELRDVRVDVFVIRTVREQMRFDTPRIVVQAGRPFEIVVENDDFMPHNLVVVKPGARDRVGVAAAALRPDQLDNAGRAYVPQSPDVLAATRLLEAGQSERLKLTAPTQEGDHEFVCTFPGHHQVMWGWLIVTKDVDAYLAAHPEPQATGSSAGADHSHHAFE